MSETLRMLADLMAHPLNRDRRGAALLRFTKWQIATRLLGTPVVVPFGRRSRLLVRRGMTGATQNVYSGLQEFVDMAFTMHVLREADLFVDIGANVGTYTILAAETGAQCIAYEPAPRAYRSLLDNIRLNDLAGIDVRNCALGPSNGELPFSTNADVRNHVLALGERDDSAIIVPIRRLDDELTKAPFLIKLDVEGFEESVIAGGKRTFRDPSLAAVVMELYGGRNRYGGDDSTVARWMLEFGFKPYRYDPFTRSPLPIERPSPTTNTIFLRDPQALAMRLREAPLCSMNGVSF